MVGRKLRGWIVIIFEHIELLARCVVGNGGTSAAVLTARPELIHRASGLIESVIMTRPSEDNRAADDGWNGLATEFPKLRPKHRSAHRPERDSAHLSSISHKRSNVSADWILDNCRHQRVRPFWNGDRVAQCAC